MYILVCVELTFTFPKVQEDKGNHFLNKGGVGGWCLSEPPSGRGRICPDSLEVRQSLTVISAFPGRSPAVDRSLISVVDSHK